MNRVFLIIVGLLSASSAIATQTDTDGSIDYGVILCHEDDEPARHPLDINILLALGRALPSQLQGNAVGIRRESCRVRNIDATCFAGPRVMECRTHALARILDASAWMLATYVRSSAEDYEAFRHTHPQAVRTAFNYANGYHDDPAVDALVKRLYASERIAADETPASAQDQALAALFQVIVDYNFAALIGHEVSHLLDDRCPIPVAARAEVTGLWNTILEEQQNGALFCPRFPEVKEVLADQCALRRIHQLRRSQADSLHTSLDASGRFARRAASDMIAFQVLTGWRRDANLEPSQFILRPLDQYLYAAYRVLLLTGEVDGMQTSPAVCGEAAGLFVHSVQESFRQCSDGGGQVSDALLDLLPDALERSWNGAPWTADSLSCRE